MCLWDNLPNLTSLKWTASRGEDAYWVGGPRADHSDGSIEGGYAFLETSAVSEQSSNGLAPPGEDNRCVGSRSVLGCARPRLLLIACECRREGKGTADSAMMESPLLESTGSRGHCVTFSYSISGLSADRLRVLLHPVQQGEDPDTPDLSQASCRFINTV